MEETDATINVMHVPVAHLVQIEVMGEPEIKEETKCCNRIRNCMELICGIIWLLIILASFAYLIFWI